MKSVLVIVLVIGLMNCNHFMLRDSDDKQEQNGSDQQSNQNNEYDPSQDCTPLETPPNIMGDIRNNQLVLAKMDIAISLNSQKQIENKANSIKDGLYCLCDFTIIKNADNQVQESDCKDLPDTLTYLPKGKKQVQTCQDYCYDFFNSKLKCETVAQC